MRISSASARMKTGHGGEVGRRKVAFAEFDSDSRQRAPADCPRTEALPSPLGGLAASRRTGLDHNASVGWSK